MRKFRATHIGSHTLVSPPRRQCSTRTGRLLEGSLTLAASRQSSSRGTACPTRSSAAAPTARPRGQTSRRPTRSLPSPTARTARPGAHRPPDRRGSEALARPRSPDGAAPPRQHHPQRDGQDRACPPRHPSPLLPRPPSIGAMPQTSRTRWCRSILRDHPAMSSHPEGLCAPPPSPAQDPTRTPHHATGRCLSEDSHGNLHLRKRVFASVSLAGTRCRCSCNRDTRSGKKKKDGDARCSEGRRLFMSFCSFAKEQC